MENKEIIELVQGIEWYKSNYDRIARHYEKVLRLGGLRDEEILNLCKVFDLEGEFGLELTEAMTASSDIRDIVFNPHRYLSYWEFARKAVEFVENDKATLVDLCRKAIFIGELDGVELRKLLKGYYCSCCANALAPFLVLRNG